MAQNVEVHITGPRYEVQPRRLIDIAARLSHGDRDPQRWIDGVTWEARQCRTLVADNETSCDPEEMPAGLTPGECETWETQTAFRLSDAWTVSTLDVAEANSDLEAFYDIVVGAAFASELLSGAASGGMSLSNTATAPTGQAFTDPAEKIETGLMILEAEIAERLQGAVGWIHASQAVHNRLVAKAAVRLENGQWRTPAGNIVITDAGYLNPPKPTAGGPGSGAATDWMYASGPVLFESTQPTTYQALAGTAVTTPWNRNKVTTYLTGYGILVFDPCPVTAVRVGFTDDDEDWNS